VIPPPERTVTVELAKALVEENWAELAPARVEAFGEGWDNFAFLVNETWVFRFPRREIAVPWIEKEHRLLPRIAPRVPLAVPDPKFFARGDERYPWPFSGYARLAGRTACAAALDDGERHACARPLGEFLRALHALPVDDAPDDAFARLDPARLFPRTRANLERLAAAGAIADAAPYLALLDGAPIAQPLRALVHGDLYSRHLLIGDARLPSGVIDWGDVHASDPAVDLALAHGFLPPRAHDAFLDAYGPVAPDRWRWAKVRAMHHAAIEALVGVDDGDHALGREGRMGLRWIMES
jgi:aminoglycoside phosphotransferase (APT) family kinase protein